MYHAGLVVLLAHINIGLPYDPGDNGGPRLAWFFRFMVHDKPRKCQLIRSFRLELLKHDGYTMQRLLEGNIVDQVASILACCSNLQALALPDCEAWMQCDAIPRALNALTNLHELKFLLTEGPKNKTIQFLSDLELPKLERLFLLRHHRFYVDDLGCPLVIAHQCRTTLRVLQFPPCELQLVDSVYPMLKTFILEFMHINTAHISTITSNLVQSLPNLEHLLLGTLTQGRGHGRYNAEPAGSVTPRMGFIHQNNRKEQYKLRMWPRLDILGGNVYALYLFAIACPVRYLQLQGELLVPQEMVMLREILDCCRPSSLKVDIELGQEGFKVHHLQMLIPEECARGISQLVVDFNFPIVPDSNLVIIMENIYALLQLMPLTFLHISLYRRLKWQLGKKFRSDSTSGYKVKVHALDPDVVAYEIAKRVPTLQYLTLIRPWTEHNQSWEIHRGEHGPNLIQKPPLFVYKLDEFGMGDVRASYYSA
ncbi:hypothetical protein K474DRAFT_1666169 [Panus rudis PR-1116 ss-1]|nr:hypothetical protein K474DRAFT_1666169 [Panus rudis PR-1116 ss-1]